MSDQLIKFENPWLAQIFASAAPEQVDQLLRFRQDFPTQKVTVGKTEWELIDAGHVDPPLLLLPGILGLADSLWLVIQRFSTKRRVIAPTYPPFDRLADLADGLAGLLDQLNIPQVDCLGSSYGGLVAQVFIRRHPSRVHRLVLAHTGPPDPQRGRQLSGPLRMMSFLPHDMLREVFRRNLSGRLAPPDDPYHSLQAGIMEEAIRLRLSRPALLAAYRRTADFDANHPFSLDELQDWPGQTLLVFAQDDPDASPEVRQRMSSFYPRSEVFILAGGDQSSSRSPSEEYFAAVERFLSHAQTASPLA